MIKYLISIVLIVNIYKIQVLIKNSLNHLVEIKYRIIIIYNKNKDLKILIIKIREVSNYTKEFYLIWIKFITN